MENIIYSSPENVYVEYEKNSPTAYTRRSITGAVVGCSKCVGYCKYHGHPGFLTKEQRRQHDCLNKGCYYYIKKQKERRPVSSVIEDHSPIVLSLIQREMSKEAVKVIRVKGTGPHEYTAFYVTITRDYSFDECTVKLQRECGITVHFVKLDHDFDTCVNLLYAT